MRYSSRPLSAYQRFIRGNAKVLSDHVCKELGELNLERCRSIPKGRPDADWRTLQDLVRDSPEKALFQASLAMP